MGRANPNVSEPLLSPSPSQALALCGCAELFLMEAGGAGATACQLSQNSGEADSSSHYEHLASP